MVNAIREARPSDAVVIAELIQELAQESGEHSPLSPAYVAKYLAACRGAILLAEQDQTVVGLLSYSLRPDLYHAAEVCLIEEFIVTASARGQGVGCALFADLTARLARLDCAELSVAVMPQNSRAASFYRRHALTEEALLLERHF